MKKQFIFVLALAATFLTNTLSANVIESPFDLSGVVKISAVNKSIIVNLGTIEREVVSIVIRDNRGSMLVNETVKKTPNFIKKYNMSRLGNGEYTMTITKTTLRTTQPFKITDDGIVMTEMEKVEKFIPVVLLNNNKLDINVLLKDFSNITVNIYDNQGIRVKQEKLENALKLHRRYNISQLPVGAYIVEVTAGDETFYHTVVK